MALAYGTAVLGTVYSLVFIFHGLAALAGAPLGGALLKWTGGCGPSLWVAGAVAAAGVGLHLWLARDGRKKGA